MGRGSVFVKDSEVVIDVNKLKKLEREVASGGKSDSEWKQYAEQLSAQIQTLGETPNDYVKP